MYLFLREDRLHYEDSSCKFNTAPYKKLLEGSYNLFLNFRICTAEKEDIWHHIA
jgi:hypothetical protein